MFEGGRFLTLRQVRVRLRPDGSDGTRRTRTRSGPRPGPGWRRTCPPSHCRASTPRPASRCHREWERTLWEGRWSAVSWPEEYGGRGADYIHWLIFEEEYYRAGAPGRVNQNGIFLLGPTIMEVGTDEQKSAVPPHHGVERDRLGAGLERAQRRLRPRRHPLDRRAERRRRRLGPQRAEDLGVTSGVGRLVLRDLPHRPGGRAPPRAHVRAGAARLGGCHRPPDRAARRRHRFRRDLLRRRARARSRTRWAR